MLVSTPVVRAALLLIAVSLGATACSPAPTPSPSSVPTATVESAARAYSAFTASWRSRYADALNAASAAADAADADASSISDYARRLGDAYQAYLDGLQGIEYPPSVHDAVALELESLDSLVALARNLAADPSNLPLKTQLQAALGRLTERSAAVEAALNLSP